jgi:predicted helicase
VFRIQQGVAIAFFVKEAGKRGPARVHHADLWGTRAAKVAALATTDAAATPWRTIHPRSELFFFVPEQSADNARYAEYYPLPAMFLARQGGIKTDRDRLFFDVSRPTLEARMRTFYSAEGLSPAFRATYRVEDSSSYQVLARRKATTFDAAYLLPCLYRPFDTRWLYYAPGLTSRPARGVMRHMLAGANVALLLCRQQATAGFAHVFCAETLVESHAVSIKTREGAFVFPLYRYTEEGERQPNFSPDLLAAIQQRLGWAFVPVGRGDLLRRSLGAEDIFHYLYALLHSPTYRQRYAARLRIDFPRVPLPPERATFAALAERGAALLDLHLLRLPTSQQGERVGGGGGSALLVDPASQGVRLGGAGSNRVEQVVYRPPTPEQPGRVMLNPSRFIEGVAPVVWEMQVGSYCPLAKWLRERAGYTLTADEMLHAARVAVALRETHRLMEDIERWVSPLL